MEGHAVRYICGIVAAAFVFGKLHTKRNLNLKVAAPKVNVKPATELRDKQEPRWMVTPAQDAPRPLEAARAFCLFCHARWF